MNNHGQETKEIANQPRLKTFSLNLTLTCKISINKDLSLNLMTAFKISAPDGVMSYSGVYSTYISLTWPDPWAAQTICKDCYTCRDCVWYTPHKIHIGFPHNAWIYRKKLLITKKAKFINQLSLTTWALTNNNKNYSHIVQSKQSVSALTFMKTVRIICFNNQISTYTRCSVFVNQKWT